jgi:hypothetical protein
MLRGSVLDGPMDRLTRHLRDGAPWAAVLWAGSAALAFVFAVAGWGAALGVSLIGCYVGDALMYRVGDQPIRSWLGSRQLASAERAVIREGAAFIGWLVIADPQAWTIVTAGAAVALVHGAHVGYRLLSAHTRRLRRGRLRWVNLTVGGPTEGPEVLPPTLPVLATVGGPRLVLHLDVFIVVGLWAAWTFDSRVPVRAALAAVVIGVTVVAWRVVVRYRLVRRLPTPEQENAQLLAAVAAVEPEVVVYFSGGPGTTYQLNVWLETIERIEPTTVIIIRERHHLDELLPTTVPVLVLPRARDVEAFHLPSIRIALYPTTVIKNNHMIRLHGIRHVFINHGDGDKSVTYSPLHRVFDEIWIAGQAARDRYLEKGEGVRAEQLVTVGRPQLAQIRRRDRVDPADRQLTVLYAPTWEGNFDGVDYSSVAPMGERIIDALLASPLGLRILFKAHPATGSRLRAAAAARAAIEERLLESGGTHEVVGTDPSSLYRAFNEADVLISDVSSVVADFLASRKPYLMTNPRGIAEDEYHVEFPSTEGGGVIAPDAANLGELVADALGPDSLRERREKVATYFLGDPMEDPIARFTHEVDRALVRASASAGRRGEARA